MRCSLPCLLLVLPILAPACTCTDATTAPSEELTGTTTNDPGSAGAGGAGAGAGTGGSILIGTGGTSAGTGGSVAAGGAGGSAPDKCIYVPPPGEFAPALDCAWYGPPAGAPYANFNDVVSTPVVINLTDDDANGIVDVNDIPDIAFITYRLQEDGCCNQRGVLRAVSGACNADGTMTDHFWVGGTEIEADIGVAGIWLDNSGGLAAGDLDADGSVDLVATVQNGGTIAFERTGTVKWYQPAHPGAATVDHLAGTTPSIADLDHDGKPEVIQGRVVLNGEDGSLAWQGSAGTGTNAFMGPVSAVGDPDLDGSLDVLAGNTMYDAAGTALWSYAFPVAVDATNCQASGFPCDGFTATGNLDDDDFGEIVIVRAGVIYVLNHDGTLLDVGGKPATIAVPQGDCTKNEGGPPTVADFDGDGAVEIGVAGADFYIVADLECLADPLPAWCSDAGIRWKVANDDCSSRVTGSSVFDFDGDGKAEVIYNDEVKFRIFSGPDGAVLFEQENHSHTRLEMPIVADVDNDGNAEIVFIENASGGTTQGIRIWGDATDSWVATRRIWNQHSYHVTNVEENGAIPVAEVANWLAPTNATNSGTMNSFRQNLPDFDAFAAPDLTVLLSLDATSCPASLGLAAKVCNAGALVVGAGVAVTFWDDATQAEIPCLGGPVTTAVPLAPGACKTVTCEWAGAPQAPAVIAAHACVDNAGYECAALSGGNNECIEDNNSADATGLGCDIPD